MAQKHITQLIDDLDGTVLDDGNTLHFSLEGRAYEIDLSDENAKKLRDAFEPYISAGRAVGSAGGSTRRPGRSRSAASSRDLGAVRAWAEQNGHQVNSRGRIPASVLEAFDAAN